MRREPQRGASNERARESTERRGERALIARLGRLLHNESSSSDRVPFGDDMAAIPASDFLWTTDMLMDGVDFDLDSQPRRAIGRKAMAVNLSDCAAMGVQPLAALCAVALDDRLSMADAEEILVGVIEMARQFDCPLVGGDTNSWAQPTVLAITIAARPKPGTKPVTRGGGRPGDLLFVSGPLGGSILGRHLSFTPRVEFGLALNRELPVHAMIDISDGLAVDLGHIADASGCGAELDEVRLRAAIHPDAVTLSGTSGKTPLEHALSDGEDFELLFALPPDVETAGELKQGMIQIGRLTGQPGIVVRSADGSRRELPRMGWEHFRGGA